MEISIPWKFKGNQAVRLDGTPLVAGCKEKPKGAPPAPMVKSPPTSIEHPE